MRYLYRTPGATGRAMHIASYTAAGVMTGGPLCHTSGGFNRSINAPFALGRPVCKWCRRKVRG